MSKMLLNFGGLINLLAGGFYFFMAVLSLSNDDLKVEMRPQMFVVTIATAILILFFAYASFLCKKDLLTTRLGKSVIALIALFYILRAVEEAVIMILTPPFFIICAVSAVLYIVIFFLPYSEEDNEEEYNV